MDMTRFYVALLGGRIECCTPSVCLSVCLSAHNKLNVIFVSLGNNENEYINANFYHIPPNVADIKESHSVCGKHRAAKYAKMFRAHIVDECSKFVVF